METNNREFKKLSQIFFLFLIILIFMFFYVENRYIIYGVSAMMLTLFYGYCQYLFRHLFFRIRQLISYIDGVDAYFEDSDLGVIYDKIEKLKQKNKHYQEIIINDKKRLKKDVADICHQMKTPLALLLLYNEKLGEHFQSEYIDKSFKQIDKMNHFINSFLKLSKVEMIALEYVCVPISDVVDIALESLASMIYNHNVNITHDYQNIIFYCDENWLQEAFINIFKNAIERDCKNISISYKKSDQYFKIFIHNDSENIPIKDLPHLFERFYRTSQSSPFGVGIGLALTKEIVLRHHGDICVYNNSGVIFEMTFPLYSLSDKYIVTKV